MKKNSKKILANSPSKNIIAHSNLASRLVIRKEFKELFPPLSIDEFDQLEANIVADGVKDPLIIWPVDGELILVDGHNRFSICKKHNLTFPWKQIEFENSEQVKDWMIRNQLGRRNLSPQQRSYLRGLRYNNEKSQGKRTDLTSDQNDIKLKGGTTAAALGKEFKVSEATIKRDGEFAEALDFIGRNNLELKESILKGKSKLTKQEVREMARNPVLLEKAKLNFKASSKLSIKVIAEIAFEFITKEERSIREICKEIQEDESTLDPVKFFLKWKSLRH